jgi:hypothetical protein
VNGEVHLRQTDRLPGLLLAVDRELFAGRLTMAFDEVGRVDEHPARAACRVEDPAVIGLDDLNDQLHDRHWREELACALSLRQGELGQEVLVDEPERVALQVLRVATDVAE